MIIVKRKKSKTLLFLISIFLILNFFLILILPFNLISNVDQSLKTLLNQPVLLKSKPIYNFKVIDYPIKIFNAIENYFEQSKNYEELKIDIKFSELEKIKFDRKKTLEKGVISNYQKVNMRLLYDGKKYDANGSFKADFSEHTRNSNQLSWIIELKNNETIFGLNKFFISNFEEKNFPYNFVISEILSENSILTPRYKIIKFNINGKNQGLMLMEEKFSDSFYAINKIKEAPIFNITNKEDFKIRLTGSKYKNVEDIVKWQDKLETEIYNENEILNKTNIINKKTNQNLLSIFKNIQEVIVLEESLLFKYLQDYVDIEKFAKTIAIKSIFGDMQNTKLNNTLFYMNPYDLKIEPIQSNFKHNDISSLEKSRNFFNSFSTIYKFFFNHPEFQKKYLNNLNKINKNFFEIERKFKRICENFGENCQHLVELEMIKKNIEFLIVEDIKVFENLNFDINKNNNNFNTKNSKNLNEKKIYFRAFNDGELNIKNLTSEVLNLESIVFKDYGVYEDYFDIQTKIYPSDSKNLNSKRIKITIKDRNYETVELKYNDENGIIKSALARVEERSFRKENFFISNTISIDNLKIKIKKKDYVFNKGKHIIDKPIIIPSGYDLVINEGTELQMSKDTYIMLKDGVLKLLGKKEKPIKIISSDKNSIWNGIYVNSISKKNTYSILKNVEISNFSYFDNNQVQLTGGINFIKSNLKISNAFINNSFAEDAINLVESNFEIDSLKIDNSISDAIDIDFGNGDLVNSSFNNIGGDAIDLSGSDVNLKNIISNNTFDKAISAGEETNLNIENLSISNARIGIASKDSSKVNGKNINVSNCKLYDFAAYQKKSFFSYGYLKVDNIYSCKKPLAQIGSSVIIDGKNVEQTNFDTKDLYDGDI